MRMPEDLLKQKLEKGIAEIASLAEDLAGVQRPTENLQFREWRDRMCSLLEREAPGWAYDEFRQIRFARQRSNGPFHNLSLTAAPATALEEPDTSIFQRAAAAAVTHLKDVLHLVVMGGAASPPADVPAGMPTELFIRNVDEALKELSRLALALRDGSEPARDPRFATWRHRTMTLLESECYHLWPHTQFAAIVRGLDTESEIAGPTALSTASLQRDVFDRHVDLTRIHLGDVLSIRDVPRARRPAPSVATGSHGAGPVTLNVGTAHSLQFQAHSPGAAQTLIAHDPAPWLAAIPALTAAANKLSGADADQAKADVEVLGGLVKAPRPRWDVVIPLAKKMAEFGEKVGSSLLAGTLLELLRQSGHL